MKYIYAASVQGIQQFIFETNKLSEIGGASEMVEDICKEMDRILEDCCDRIPKENYMLQAAGNIRLIADENVVEKIVKYFPFKVQQKVPGVTISQVAIPIGEDGSGLTVDVLNTIEDRLKMQRNKAQRPAPMGLTVAKRCSRTGRPAFKQEKNLDNIKELVDLATWKKRKRAKDGNDRLASLLDSGNPQRFSKDIDKIVSNGHKNWIAIIHIDGNSLGKWLQRIAAKLKNRNAQEVRQVYTRFSNELNKATQEAAKIAFEMVVVPSASANEEYAFRPIILGGDDVTIICRGDLAIDFTKTYIAEFEKKTKERLSWLADELGINAAENGLTACAGIAYAKAAYPFHYAYQLAEELCAHAKKKSKEINDEYVPSSIAFHKVLSSFHENYNATCEKELNYQGVSLVFGPYSIYKNESLPLIDDLLECVRLFKEKDAPCSSMRKWLAELKLSKNRAEQTLQRMEQVMVQRAEILLDKLEDAFEKLCDAEDILDIAKDNKTPIFDILTLLSLEGKE